MTAPKTAEQVADRAINLWNAYTAGRISKEQMGAEIIRFVVPQQTAVGPHIHHIRQDGSCIEHDTAC